MMVFRFVSLPKYAPPLLLRYIFGASIDWKGNMFAYIYGGM